LDDLSLCKYSKSRVLWDLVLYSCPLSLNATDAKKCPCKKRAYLTHNNTDLRVNSCLFPATWRGDKIRDPDRFRAALDAKKKKGKDKMAETGTQVIETKSVEPAEHLPLWGGTKIPIIGVSGEKGSGKTLFLSSIRPQSTLMIDLEDSSASYNIPFAKRISLYDEMAEKNITVIPKPLEMFIWFRDIITNVEPGLYDNLSADPLSDIESGLVDWVKENPAEFGHTANQYEKAAGILWGDVKSYWKILLGMVSAKFQTFSFSTHMGAVWKGSAPVPGKRKPKGKDTLMELASLYLLLERKPDANGKVPEKPTAIVLKSRLAVTEIDKDGEVSHHPILPPNLPVATPAAIRAYIKSPPNYKKLKKGELLAPEEVLSEDEKLLLQHEIAESEKETAEIQLSRLERMQDGAKAQAATRQKQATATAAVTLKEQVKPEAKPTPAPEPTPEANGLVTPEKIATLEGQRDMLKIGAKMWLAIMRKRNPKLEDISELTAEEAEELRERMWDKITASKMDQEGKTKK